ncbi:glucose-1-phosphate adenylyltransferase [Longilinea arvoryzae]|nr:glucose-1-phosphate adenylyltransferase [Longilinea arvoryzae]
MDNILAVILGGGRGSRLYPLTKMRSKPAVPMAGKYRLIDIPISNCINSGIYRIAVLTQFNSVSLHRHISRTYQFDAFHVGWVQVWAAEQTMSNIDWYQGTADAVRKQLNEIRSAGAAYTLILAGDHLYRMDYGLMANFHADLDADITVAVQPVARENASRLGILKRGENYRITRFAEKPKEPEALEAMVSLPNSDRPFLGSMGIYLFKTEVLVKLLEGTTFTDFGGEIIPTAIENYKVMGYDFNDYWEDIGTIRSFYETNLALASPNPPFNIFDPKRPIYSHARFLPGTVLQNSRLENVLLSDGCCIKNAELRNCVIGVRSQIRDGVKLYNTILMGSDYYDEVSSASSPDDGRIPMGIGEGSIIDGAIIDKNAHIGRGVIIRPFPRDCRDIDNENWFVRDGVVVIPKNATLLPGLTIGPELLNQTD